MKKTLLAILIIVLSVMAFMPVIKQINYYAVVAEVVELDYSKDEIVFRTWNGFDYRYKGIEDWCIGDAASLCMNDNGTDFVMDDKIVNARYDRIDFDSPKRDIRTAQELQKGK